MKNHIRIAVVSWLSAALFCAAVAGVPLSWNVDVSRVQPVRLDAYHGETLDLSATLLSGRAPLSIDAGTASFLWQTNGMGSAWWQTNATISATGVVHGTFGPAMDTGADSVRFFFSVVSGSGANYRAAGTIALRPSPGASPTTADLAPQTVINFADYQLVNAPWITVSDTAEAVRAATNALSTTLQARDNSLATAIQDAARTATNYTDLGVAGVAARLTSATNAVTESGRAALVAAATSASNYTDAAISAIDIPSLSGYATEAWVQGRGYLTQHQSLSGYATEAWVGNQLTNISAAIPSLDGYATRSFVTNQGYLTAHQPLSGYATEAWVQGRGYLTQHQSLSGYATEAWVGNQLTNISASIPSLEGYATKSFVTNQGYLTAHQPLAGYATEAWVQSRGYLTEHQPLSGYATETYAQSAASGAQAAAESYARSLAWATSAGSTRLVSLDGSTWQDATGTVWQVSAVYGWAGTVIDLPTTTTRAIRFDPVPGSKDVWSAGGGTNISWDATGMQSFVLGIPTGSYDLVWADDYPPADATNITFTTSAEKYYLYYSVVSLATNPVDRVLYASDSGDAATAERALTYGTPTRWTDATGCVWEVGDPSWRSITDGVEFHSFEEIAQGEYAGMWDLYFSVYGDAAHVYTNAPSLHQEIFVPAGGWWYHDDMDTDRGNFPVAFTLTPTTNMVGRVALTNDLPDTASIQSDIADLRTESALVYRLYSGSNVVAEVTNYNSQVHAPSLRLLQLNESNEYVTVWTETNGLARTLRDATAYTDAAITNAAPRAWSRTTSGLGAEAPSNTTWISTPTTVIAGGFEYAKFIDTYGEVWVLSSNGMAADFDPDTNAYFRITADDGTAVLSIEKSDAQVVGANAAGITVGETSVTVPVPVVSQNHPSWFWRYSLAEGDWGDEVSAPQTWDYDWTGGTGAWVLTIDFNDTRPSSLFFKFSFLQEGGVVIRNNAQTDLSAGIYVNGVKFVPSVSGNNLIWTKQ